MWKLPYMPPQLSVAAGILVFLVAASVASGAQVERASRAIQPKVSSTLDRKPVLPHQIRWQAKTNVPAAAVEEIDLDKVRELTRVQLGPLTLHGLPQGAFRPLSPREVKQLYKLGERPKEREKPSE